MHKFIFTFFLVLSVTSAYSQTIVDIKTYGNAVSVHSAYDVEVDQCNNIYTCGIFQGGGIRTIDSLTVPTSGYTGVLIKHAANGNAIWVRTLTSGTNLCRCAYYDITTDTLCNIYVSGSVSQGNMILEGDTIPTIGGLLIVKYDQNGNRLWYKIFESRYADQRFGIDYSKSGYLYAGLWFYDSLNVNGHIYQTNFPSPASNIVLVKMEENGTVVWSKMFGNGNESTCYSIAANDSGNIMFTGKFTGMINFGNNHFADASILPQQIGAYIAWCDSQGASTNARLFGSNGDFYRVSKYNNTWLSSGSNGDNVIHGKYPPGVPGLEFSGHTDPFNDLPKGYGSCMDPFGNMYVTGKFDDTFSLSDMVAGHYLTSPGNRYDAYLGAYNSSNIITGLVRIPNPGFMDAGNAVAFHPPAHVLVAGEQGLVSTGKNYMLAIYDVSQILAVTDNNAKSCFGYPNPASDYFTINLNGISKIYSVEVFGPDGKKLKQFNPDFRSTDVVLDVHDCQPGIYTVRINSEDKNACIKMVKM